MYLVYIMHKSENVEFFNNNKFIKINNLLIILQIYIISITLIMNDNIKLLIYISFNMIILLNISHFFIYFYH